jgi:hypothetical protein
MTEQAIYVDFDVASVPVNGSRDLCICDVHRLEDSNMGAEKIWGEAVRISLDFQCGGYNSERSKDAND